MSTRQYSKLKLRESLLFTVYIPYIFTLFDEFSFTVCPIAYKWVGVFAIIIKGPLFDNDVAPKLVVGDKSYDNSNGAVYTYNWSPTSNSWSIINTSILTPQFNSSSFGSSESTNIDFKKSSIESFGVSSDTINLKSIKS